MNPTCACSKPHRGRWPHPRRKVLTFGDFVAGVYYFWGERKAVGIVRFALEKQVVEFRGRERYVIS